MVGQQHMTNSVRLGQLGQGCVTRVARRRFDALAGRLLDLHSFLGDRHAQLAAQRMHLSPPRVGGGLQAVMHMEQRQADTQLAGHGRRMHGKHG